MNRDDFAAALNEIRPGSDHAAEIWSNWAEELEEYDRSGDRQRPFKTADSFRAEFMEQFTKIRHQYGVEVARQIISLGDIPHCLFPWEMSSAASHLAAGGRVEDIPELSVEGMLENFEQDQGMTMQM